MPIEILETIANINYNAPRPRPVDVAVLFDMVKVRRLVDEATNLAVRAASSIASPTLTSVHGGMPGGQPLNSFGIGGSPHGGKLSRERKFRMREQASQKLARAYRLDEIACSVATMQGASPLEDVGALVLQRSPKDSDARYVHFFHEKIPSRQLAETTSLQPLTDIISDRPGDPEVLRTRATVRCFKDDFEGAAQDLTQALSVYRFHTPSHNPVQEIISLQEQPRNKRRPQDVILAEKDQPSGLESQLLFHRASCYLTMACNHVVDGIQSPAQQDEHNGLDGTSKTGVCPEENTNGVDAAPEADVPSQAQVESRKLVKTLAKRALRDYMSFISQFDYSPNLPIRVAKDFNDRVNLAARGLRNTRTPEPSSPVEPYVVYSLADLLAAVAPSDLPPYPSQDVVKHNSATPPPMSPSCEWITYHPLLTDALHSLLLCHCLAQTSTKELQRHAYMVARLVRLTDGYPIFQATRSPARADWVEIVRRADNWLQLTATWESLCTPAPLPTYDANATQMPMPSSSRAASAAALVNGTSADAAAEDRRKELVRQQAILDSLEDDRVTDEASFHAAVRAREKRAEQDRALLNQGGQAGHTNGAQGNTEKSFRRWSAEDGREYPIQSERASAIAQWVREAPIVTGMPKRKKRTKKPANGSKANGVTEGLDKLDLEASSMA